MLLAYDDDGPGPVVVLLHAFPLDRSIWASQAATIGSSYRVITPDLRGFGETPAPEGIYPIDDMAGDVVELLDALKITEPIVLGGLSMGGYVALSMAVRHPKRLRALILMDTKAEADSAEAALHREAVARQVEASGDAGIVARSMLPRLFSHQGRDRRADVVARVGERMRGASPRGIAGALRGMASRADRTADLARIAMPTLVMVGSEDEITPAEGARAMAGAIPNAQFVEIPGVGHLSPLEDPAAANAAILRFLQSLA